MDHTKLAHQLFNLSEEIYLLFCHIVFFQVCDAYSIIPDGFTVNKNPCIGKPSKKLMSDWESELLNVESKLRDLVLYEYVEKLFKSEETFNSLFEEFLIQDDWLLKVRGHLEKYEKILRRRKLKELRKLTKSNTFLFFECLGEFDSHEPFFFCLFKHQFLKFCNSFVPDFENLHNLIHLMIPVLVTLKTLKVVRVHHLQMCMVMKQRILLHFTENIPSFLDFHLQPITEKVKSYVKDTNDFLKKLHSLTNLPGNSLFCTMDVVGLHRNILHDEGLSALRKRLNERDKKDVSTYTLVELAELILKNSIFNFNKKTLKQKRGTAIGTKFAPPYSILFMAELEENFFEKVDNKPYLWWRYIDDTFFIWDMGKS